MKNQHPQISRTKSIMPVIYCIMLTLIFSIAVPALVLEILRRLLTYP
jgi:hypothetical protein